MVLEHYTTMSLIPQTTMTNTTTSTPINAHHSFSVKLTTKNYLAWKTQFVPLLNYQNLHVFIDGSSVAPPKTIISTSQEALSNLAYQTWFQKDQMLLT